MTESTNQSGKSEKGFEGSAADSVRRAFAGLPLDQKLLTLMQVEVDMLGDAVGSVITVASKAVDELAKVFESATKSGPAASDAGGQASGI